MESNKYLFTKEELDALIADERAAEREACAKACDEYAVKHGLKGDDNNKAQGWMMMQCAAAIRARGQQ